MNENNLKPFDLEKAKQGAKLVTRDGRPARIICWDLKCEEFPIVAVFMNKHDEEDIETYTTSGNCVNDSDNPLDLFMTPNIVERWVNVYKNKNGYYYGDYYDSEQEAIKNKNDDDYIATTKISWEE